MRSLVFLIVLAAFGALSAAQQSSIPDDIRADVANGDYRSALTKIEKQLFPSTQAPGPSERYQLLMLKGECQLQLKDRIGSASAFKSAAKVATNAGELADARANALIIERSTSGRYTPRFGTGVEPIDILPMDARKRAMIAYQAELASQYKSQIDAALRADKLPPIEQVFSHVADMYALELFATGQAADTEQLAQDLGARAFGLMESEVATAAGRVDYLGQLANSASDNSRGWNTGRLGLTSQQRDEVKAMLPYLSKIRDRAVEYRRIAGRMGGNEVKWDALVAQTVDAIADAESLYNDR